MAKIENKNITVKIVNINRRDLEFLYVNCRKTCHHHLPVVVCTVALWFILFMHNISETMEAHTRNRNFSFYLFLCLHWLCNAKICVLTLLKCKTLRNNAYLFALLCKPLGNKANLFEMTQNFAKLHKPLRCNKIHLPYHISYFKKFQLRQLL